MGKSETLGCVMERPSKKQIEAAKVTLRKAPAHGRGKMMTRE
jgi:hypothetical protein